MRREGQVQVWFKCVLEMVKCKDFEYILFGTCTYFLIQGTGFVNFHAAFTMYLSPIVFLVSFYF